MWILQTTADRFAACSSAEVLLIVACGALGVVIAMLSARSA